MARDPKEVQANLLAEAIAQARPLLRRTINKVESKGAVIRVEAHGEAVFFQVNESHSVQHDEITGEAFRVLGGDRYDLIRISEAKRVEAEAVWHGKEGGDRQVWRRWLSKALAISGR